MSKLKPCPFCGSDNVRLHPAYDRWFVRCEQCETQTGLRDELDAVALWETRTSDEHSATVALTCKLCGEFLRESEAVQLYRWKFHPPCYLMATKRIEDFWSMFMPSEEMCAKLTREREARE